MTEKKKAKKKKAKVEGKYLGTGMLSKAAKALGKDARKKREAKYGL